MMTQILAPPYFHRVDSPAKTCSHQGDKVGKASYINSMSTSQTPVTMTQKYRQAKQTNTKTKHWHTLCYS